MTATAKGLPTELIDGLLSGYQKPEELIGESRLLKQLTKVLMERALKSGDGRARGRAR